jgi:hypothetical protein
MINNQSEEKRIITTNYSKEYETLIRGERMVYNPSTKRV